MAPLRICGSCYLIYRYSYQGIMLSLSTQWNQHRHTDGENLLQEIRGLGFPGVEFGAGMKLSLLPGLKRLAKRGRVKVTSIENFFPAPLKYREDFDSIFHFATTRSADQQKAIQWTLQTIDYATEFGAPCVIVQVGRSGMDGYSDSLVQQIEENQIHSRRFVRDKLAGIERRAQNKGPLLAAVRKAFDQILPYAEKKGVKIALRSPMAYEDLPNEIELQELLQEYAGTPLGYWHDFGAVQVRANLGFLHHLDWLKSMRDHIYGCHVHDVMWPNHPDRLPLSGMIEFGPLLEALPSESPLVWKISPDHRAADIKQALPPWIDQASVAA
ncbi:MAG: TIM barrel protein [Verrucomicrobiota bacterium]